MDTDNPNIGDIKNLNIGDIKNSNPKSNSIFSYFENLFSSEEENLFNENETDNFEEIDVLQYEKSIENIKKLSELNEKELCELYGITLNKYNESKQKYLKKQSSNAKSQFAVDTEFKLGDDEILQFFKSKY